MSDTLITIIAIFLAAILMFIFPLMSISERNDDISQTVVQTAISEFIDEVSITGQIKSSSYDACHQRLAATGNTYDIEIEVQHLDENPGKKASTTSGDLVGENERYSTYTTEILRTIETSGNYTLKKGDNVTITVKNTNRTIAQMLRSFFYKVTGQGTSQIAATASSMVVTNGNV